MGSQNNPGQQSDPRHKVTVLAAAAAMVANRFMAYDGNYATAAGGVKDCQGISSNGADNIGDPIVVVTHYSYLVEAGAVLAFGDYVKPDLAATGKAIVGALADHCGRALGDAQIGDLVEVQVVKHIHA